MKDIQGTIFDDFEPPATTDGSYRGGLKHRKATEEHYHMKFDQELLKVNQRLKVGKVKVSIESYRGALQLRATLPLRPNDTNKNGKDTKQYKISLGIPANCEGLKTAEEEAYELGKLIARKMFIWTDKYLGTQASRKNNITFKEFYEQFEDVYFSTRKRTLKSEGTFKIYLGNYKRVFLSDSFINAESLKNKLLTVNSPAVRNEVIKVARIIAKALSIDVDFSELTLKHKKRHRKIPDDKQVVSCVNYFQNKYENNSAVRKEVKDNWKIYKLAYGLLATYGLRPREIVNNPNFNWFLSKDNIHNTFKVHESNKTGYREVFPFVPDWVELFDLKNQESIELFKTALTGSETSDQLEYKVQLISKNFCSSKIPFQPYDLRHACAIRAHLMGVPIKAASDNLGHSVEMHTKVYQSHFGIEHRRKAFEQSFDGMNELDKLKDEIARLRKRNAELELELSRYQLRHSM
ncbi:MAG: site-specific integrase [Richelia sp. SL_2_1]|nr:site-specific integrase [Richelia sp. SL_2_1]